MTNSNSLITKYRPTTFAEVIGNQAVVKGLQEAISSPSHHHSYLFIGPSGVGKTTLARIVADHFNCWVQEIDAASNSGVDDMRGLVASTGFTSVFTKKNRAIIIDEAHNLSKKGWEPLLKPCEEPPEDLYFFFCSTEPSTIPKTIRSRCHEVVLKPVSIPELSELLEAVCQVEGWTVQNEVFQAIVQAATGQPRKALSFLQAGHGAQNREELAQVISQVESDTSPLLGLCNFLLKGGRDWKRISDFLSKIDESDDVFASACRYMTNAMVSSDEATARKAWILLDALLFPSAGYDKKSQLANAVGKIVFGG